MKHARVALDLDASQSRTFPDKAIEMSYRCGPGGPH
jgi:hypothetical protein